MPDHADPLEALAAEEAADREEDAATSAEVQGDAESTNPEPSAEPEADDDAPEWQRYGFKSPEAMWKSFQEANSKIQDQGRELGELRAFQREAAQTLQQIQQGQQPQAQQGQTLPDGSPYYDPAQLRAWVNEGELDPFDAAMILVNQQTTLAQHQALDQFGQRLAPLEAMSRDRGLRDTLDDLNAKLGDDVVARNAEYIGELLQQDRDHFAHPQHGARRLREAIIAAEWDRQNGVPDARPRDEQGRFAPADTYVEGGSSAQGPQRSARNAGDPEEQALVASLTTPRPVDEMGIPLPRG